MRRFLVFALIATLTNVTRADGLSSMSLAEVLPGADAVVVTEIVSDRLTQEEEHSAYGHDSIFYTYRIKATAVRRLRGESKWWLDIPFQGRKD